jgi:hypothetical protein
MSNEEFDNYLALLAKLLRLGEQQREQIAGELRAHLEDRLDDLLSRGMPRHEAVKLALEEFGDAAVLADDFVSISRNRKRRWMMRITTLSAAAIVLIAAGVFTFWPGTNAGPGAAALVAQDPAAGGPGVRLPGIGPGSQGPMPVALDFPKVATLDERLDQRIDVDFADTPLRDVIEFLHQQTGIAFYTKAQRLEDAGVNADSPLTLNLKQVRVSTLLDLMLEEIGLVYTEKDDLIVITTEEDSRATMEVRVYDCRDLLAMPTGLPGAGGPHGMSMPGMPGMMMPGMGTPSVGHPFAPPRTDSAYPGGPPTGTPGTGAPDGFASPDADGGLPTPPTTEPRRTPRSSTLPPPGDGGFGPGGAPAADPAPRRVPESVLPQLGGLGGVGGEGGGFGGGAPMGGMPGGMGGMMGGMGMGSSDSSPRQQRPLSEQDLKAEQLMNIVTTAVDPDSWSEVGGPGTIGQYNGLIVVSQSARTHAKIEKVLDMLREAGGLPKTKSPRVVR